MCVYSGHPKDVSPSWGNDTSPTDKSKALCIRPCPVHDASNTNPPPTTLHSTLPPSVPLLFPQLGPNVRPFHSQSGQIFVSSFVPMHLTLSRLIALCTGQTCCLPGAIQMSKARLFGLFFFPLNLNVGREQRRRGGFCVHAKGLKHRSRRL